MKTIRLNVEGIPQEVVDAIREVVDTLRAHFQAKRTAPPPRELPEWPGEVIEPLDRSAIYEDED